MIKCQECGAEKLQITWKHLRRHSMTTKQYKSKYPGAPLQDETIILRGDRNPFFGKHHTKELKQWQSEHFTGRPNPKNAAHRQAFWASEKGDALRNVMKSDDYKQTMKIVMQAHWNSHASDKHRQKNSESLKKYRPSYEEKLNEVRQTQDYRDALSKGIKHMWDTMPPIIKKQRIEKQAIQMMKNGTLSSNGENELFDLLQIRFPNIKRAIWFHPSKTGSKHLWNIDFYIPEIDTYVQFDGVYWHGLDRPIEKIRELGTKRNDAICQKWEIDREQDEWFSKNNKRLIRITDLEFKKSKDDCILKITGNDVILA